MRLPLRSHEAGEQACRVAAQAHLSSRAGSSLLLGDGVDDDLLGLQLARLQALPLTLKGQLLLALQRLTLLYCVPLRLCATSR